MNTRQARKARALAIAAINDKRRPHWGHLEQTVFLLALSFGAQIDDAEEVWNRVRAEPMLPTLAELADLVGRVHIDVINDRIDRRWRTR